MKRNLYLTSAFAALLTGCLSLPSVGPDYSEPDMSDLPEFMLPDAGFPTTNRTAVGEWKPAGDDMDFRTAVTTNEIQCWWQRFISCITCRSSRSWADR